MIALLYGVVRRTNPATAMNGPGILGADVLSREYDDLALLYSLFPAPLELPMPQSAVQFHEILRIALDSGGLVPYRLPAWLQEQQIAPHLAQSANQYRAALDRTAECLQMEMQLAPLYVNTVLRNDLSGREYLQSKAATRKNLANAAEKIREQLGGFSREWTTRPSNNGVKLFALVPRETLQGFRNASGALRINDMDIRISGPWAATEFMDIAGDKPAHE